MSESHDDAALVAAYLDQGDERALETLFRRHLRPVFALVSSMLTDAAAADDVTQEAFIKAWKHLRRYDPSRNFRTWLFAIAKRTALDALKKRRDLPFSGFEDADGGNALADSIEDDAPLPSELFDRADAAVTLAKAVAKLPLAQRTVLHLHYADDLTLAEIAEVLEEPVDTVKSRHRRAVAALKALFAEDAPGSPRAS